MVQRIADHVFKEYVMDVIKATLYHLDLMASLACPVAVDA